MHVDPDGLQPRQPRGLGIDLPRPGDRDAELVLRSCRSRSSHGSSRPRPGSPAPSPAPPTPSDGGHRATAPAISGSLSTLNCRTPPSSAMRISSRVLPTPENTIRSPGTPAAFARAGIRRLRPRPSPRPDAASVFRIAWFARRLHRVAHQMRPSPPAPRRRAGNAASASPSNSSRRACPPPPAISGHRHVLGMQARRRGRGNGPPSQPSEARNFILPKILNTRRLSAPIAASAGTDKAASRSSPRCRTSPESRSAAPSRAPGAVSS
jgi:hypothetical protein